MKHTIAYGILICLVIGLGVLRLYDQGLLRESKATMRLYQGEINTLRQRAWKEDRPVANVDNVQLSDALVVGSIDSNTDIGRSTSRMISEWIALANNPEARAIHSLIIRDVERPISVLISE